MGKAFVIAENYRLINSWDNEIVFHKASTEQEARKIMYTSIIDRLFRVLSVEDFDNAINSLCVTRQDIEKVCKKLGISKDDLTSEEIKSEFFCVYYNNIENDFEKIEAMFDFLIASEQTEGTWSSIEV